VGAHVLTDADLEPLRREIAELRAQVAERSIGSVLSTEQAASLAGVKPKTVRTWVEAGALAATKRGRRLVIRRADLEAYLSGSPARSMTILSALTPRTG
jgi:excisionase family DNA binding protein